MYLSRKPAPLIFTRDMKLLSELEYNLPMVTVDYTKYNKGDSDVLRSTDEMNQNLVKVHQLNVFRVELKKLTYTDKKKCSV